MKNVAQLESIQYKLWLNPLEAIKGQASKIGGGWYYQPVGIYSNLPIYGRTKDRKKAKSMGYLEALNTCQSFRQSGYKCRLVPRITIEY